MSDLFNGIQQGQPLLLLEAPAIYEHNPPEPPKRYARGQATGSVVTVYRLNRMTAEQLAENDLIRYIKGVNENATETINCKTDPSAKDEARTTS